jgi:abhydrolase domain-containing protein 6
VFKALVSRYSLLLRFATLLFFAGGLLAGVSGRIAKADCDFSPATVNVGGGEIHYDRAGIGPAVILLHGLFAQKEQWQDVLCTLAAAGFDAIALDLPGFGKSDNYPVTVYDLNREVELLNSFINALKIEAFSLAGNSMGGTIAALSTERYPGKVLKLAFIGPPLGLVSWGPRVRQAIIQGVNPFIPMDSTQFDLEMALLFAHPPEVADEVRNSLIRDNVSQNHHYQQVWNIVNLFDTVLQDPPKEHLLRETPVLILWGESDAIYPVAGAEFLHKLLPNSRLVTFPETGHLPMMEKPAETGRVLVQFLRKSANQEVPFVQQ